VTLIVSGLRVAAPRSWSSAAGQAIVSRRVSPGTDPAGDLAGVAGEMIGEAGWVDLSLGPDGSLPCAARLDVVLWSAGGDPPGNDDIGMWIGAVTRAADPLSLLGANWSREPLMPVADPWTCELTQSWQRWPGGWYELERTSRVAITCTRSALSAVRVWFVASAAGYVDEAGGESLSGLLETDDRRPVRGALAQYAGYLAVERRHRVAGMLLSATADKAAEAGDPVGHAVEVANLRQAETNLNVTVVNVAASADRLAARLGSRGTRGWAFLTADARELEASLATVRGNVGRAAAVQDRLQVMQAHADALRQQAETHANSYATLLLTVAAGAFAGAALPSQHRAAAAAAFGGALFAISLLVVDAARPYLRIHRLLVVIVLAGAGAAGAAALSLTWSLTLAGAAVGGAAGYGVFLLARALGRQPPWPLVAWLTRQQGTPRRRRETGQDPSAGSSA
jgi:hypothetical protein